MHIRVLLMIRSFICTSGFICISGFICLLGLMCILDHCVGNNISMMLLWCLLLLLILAINVLLFLRIACHGIFRWIKVYVMIISLFMIMYLWCFYCGYSYCYFSLLIFFSSGLLVTPYLGWSKLMQWYYFCL